MQYLFYYFKELGHILFTFVILHLSHFAPFQPVFLLSQLGYPILPLMLDVGPVDSVYTELGQKYCSSSVNDVARKHSVHSEAL